MKYVTTIALVLVIALLPQMTAGQDKGAPPPAAIQPVGVETPENQEAAAAPHALLDENRPLTGVLEQRVSYAPNQHGLLTTSFSVSAFSDNNPQLGQSGSREYGTSLSGNFDYRKMSSANDLLLGYSGGGMFYAGASELNSTFHNVSIAETLTHRRITFLVLNEFSYVPNTPLSSMSDGVSTSRVAISPGIIPDDSVLVGQESRYANTSVAQLDYALSRRTSLTFSGSYGLMRFSSNTLQSSNQIGFSAGWNHRLSRSDQIGIKYTGQLYRFLERDTHVDAHAVSLVFSHAVGRRAVINLSGGPQIQRCGTCGVRAFTNVSWSGHAGVDYRVKRSTAGISLSRTPSAGAGVSTGGVAMGAEAHVSHQLSRAWDAVASGSYARSEGAFGAQKRFYARQAGFGLSRRLTPFVSAHAQYDVESGTSIACQASVCQSPVRQMVRFGVDFNLKPFVMR